MRIASCTFSPESILPEILGAFQQAYPQVHESVSVSDTAEATLAVEVGAADLGFVAIRPKATRLQAKLIHSEELLLVAPTQHRLAKCRNVTAKELRQEPLIFRERSSGTRQCVEQAFLDANIRVHELVIVLETNSNDAIRGAVKQGIGVAFLSRTATRDDISQGRLIAVNVADLHIRMHLYLITDPQRLPTPAVRVFRNFVESRTKVG